VLQKHKNTNSQTTNLVLTATSAGTHSSAQLRPYKCSATEVAAGYVHILYSHLPL